MFKLDKILPKCGKYLTIFVLLWTLVSLLMNGYRVRAEADLSSMGDIPEAVNEAAGVNKNEPNVVTATGNLTSAGILNAAVTTMGVAAVVDSPEQLGEIMENSTAARKVGFGFVGKTDKALTAMIYNYPMKISPGNYMVQEWSPKAATTVSAAKTGTEMLDPIHSLWKYVCNITYVGFVVVTIIIAFMIMFRQKIGGQVAVTITNAIPRVLIGMVLVHLSYFIAGLILSFGTFLMGLSGYVLSKAGKEITGVDYPTLGLGGPWHIWRGVKDAVLSGVDTDSTNVTPANFFNWHGVGALGGVATSLLSLPAIGIPVVLVSIATAFPGTEIVELIIKLIFSVGLIYAGIRIFFNLLLAYANIFMSVVILPIVTLVGSLPGQEKIIINSYKAILSNALMFPATYLMLNLGVLVSVASVNSPITFPESIDTAIVEPGGGNLGGFVGYAIILATVSVKKLIDEFMKNQQSQGMQAVTQNIMQMSQKTPVVGKLLAQ